MRNIIKPNLSNLVIIIFFLTYPLDLLFYGATSRGFTSIPVGFLGNILITSFIVLIPFLLCSRKNWSLFSISKLNWILISVVFLFFILIISRVSLSDNFIAFDLYFWWINFTKFILGIFFAKIISDDRIQIYKLSLTFILYFSAFLFSFPALEDYNYLRSGDSLLILSLLLLVITKKFYFVFSIFILSLITFYMVDSRAALFLFLVGSSLIFIKRYPFKYIIPIVIIGFISLSYILYQLYANVSNINNNRLVRIIFERENDTSFLSREFLHDKAIEVFLKNVWLGDYAYYRQGDNAGYYSHDYWSFLSEFGILGVLIIVGIFIIAILNLILINKKKDNLSQLAFSLSIILIVGITFAKSYSWGLLYFIIGFLIFRLTNLKRLNS